MSKPEMTPGPWMIDGGTHIVTAGNHLLSRYPDHKTRIAEVTPAKNVIDGITGRTIGGIWDAVTAANAQAIAALPELIEALRFLVGAAEVEPEMRIYREHIKLARAALKKAGVAE